MSRFWRDTFQAFYDSGKRQLVLSVGRRGGKSSNLCKLAVCEALYGDHAVPAGDVAMVALVSAGTTDAKARLRTIAAMLRALRIKHTQRKDDITLEGRPVAFRVFAASIAACSGFTSCMVLADEVSKWKDKDTGANPSTEVLAAIRPTAATLPNARIVLSSSPMGLTDAHHLAFELGDTAQQMVAHAPTWIANPTVTEDQTHALEPHYSTWSREYAAEPQAAISAAFEVETIDRMFAVRPPVDRKGPRILVLDPSSLKKDAFTFGIVGWNHGPDEILRDHDGQIRVTPWGEPQRRANHVAIPSVLTFDRIGELASRSGDQVVDEIVAIARSAGVRTVVADQREELLLRAGIERRGLKYRALVWGNPSKVEAVSSLRRWLADGRLSVPECEPLRRELLGFEEKLTPSGSPTFGARRGGHDDYVALLLTSAMAESEGLISSSPHRSSPFRGMRTTRCGLAF